jgi:hypothetical protein
MLGTTDASASLLRALPKFTNFSSESPFKPIVKKENLTPHQKHQLESNDSKENMICISIKKENPVEKVADIKR